MVGMFGVPPAEVQPHSLWIDVFQGVVDDFDMKLYYLLDSSRERCEKSAARVIAKSGQSI